MNALEGLKKVVVTDCDSKTLSFVRDKLHLARMKNYDVVFDVEVFCRSPATYRFKGRSQTI